jgi:hypothetical protein
MAVKASAQKKTAAGPWRAPTHEEIAIRSYELYLARGGADGHDVQDWLDAEKQLNQAG